MRQILLFGWNVHRSEKHRLLLDKINHHQLVLLDLLSLLALLDDVCVCARCTSLVLTKRLFWIKYKLRQCHTYLINLHNTRSHFVSIPSDFMMPSGYKSKLKRDNETKACGHANSRFEEVNERQHKKVSMRKICKNSSIFFPSSSPFVCLFVSSITFLSSGIWFALINPCTINYHCVINHFNGTPLMTHRFKYKILWTH